MTNRFISICSTDIEKKGIETHISLSDLDKRLADENKTGVIRGEHWYRDAQAWYDVVFAYNNPYNYGTVHSELFLLRDNRKTLSQLVRDFTLVFYGLGVGETEMEIVDWQLEDRNYAEIVGVDVNRHFIDQFIGGLRNKLKERRKYKINFRGYHALFEQIRPENLDFDNSGYNKRTHICLGNTIGNFQDQKEVFRLFSVLSKPSDLLILGFQLDTKLEILFRKYATSPAFARFVLSWEKNSDYSRLRWKLDRKKLTIKALYRGIEVFRSKKYKSGELRGFISGFGYKPLLEFTDSSDNSCIQIYERV